MFQQGYWEEKRRNATIIPATAEQLAAQKERSAAIAAAIAAAEKTDPNFKHLGWGDKLHRVLGPIGRAIHWPCMKGDGTTDLKPGSPCDKGRTFLNDISQGNILL
jgi:hypothetical protein